MADAGRPAAGDPVTMAMHIHGSFSEGPASMDAHLYQARRLGVDVIWWTDHDFRAAAHGFRTAVGFDDLMEKRQFDTRWRWDPMRWGELAASGHAFVTAPHSPDEEGSACRVWATAPAGGGWATYLLEGHAYNSTYSTSYADTVLELDVLPEVTSGNAQVVVEVVSSYRPPSGGRPAGQYRMQYRVGAPRGRSLEANGLRGVIGVPAGNGWQRLRMDLRADHAALWPDTVSRDASLYRIRVGVRVRNGASARGVVDRLRFHRERRSAADGRAMVQDAMRPYRDRYPAIRQFAGVEVSMVPHLNAFGGDGTWPQYPPGKPRRDYTVRAQRDMVRFLHGHGSTVSINHPSPGENLSRQLVRTDGVGADLIEIGTGVAVERLAESFDVAARNAVFLTATGVSDDHVGHDWLKPQGKRWITGTWCSTRRRDDLCAAVRAGRAWFYDPLWWRGEFDLLADGRVPMGGVLLTRHRRVSLRVTATRLPGGGSVEVIRGRCDRAGAAHPQALNRSTTVPAREVTRGSWSTDVFRGDGCYVRAMVRNAQGAVVGFSNPVWLLPARLDGDVSVPRARRWRDD